MCKFKSINFETAFVYLSLVWQKWWFLSAYLKFIPTYQISVELFKAFSSLNLEIFIMKYGTISQENNNLFNIALLYIGINLWNLECLQNVKYIYLCFLFFYFLSLTSFESSCLLKTVDRNHHIFLSNKTEVNKRSFKMD